MSGAGEGGWCFDYPMPPSEQQAGGGRGGGGGGGGGRGRVAGIGNMKLKVDKKAAKRNKQKAAAAALKREAAETAAAEEAVASLSQPQEDHHQQEQEREDEQAGGGGGGTANNPVASTPASPPRPARSPSPPQGSTVVEDFPVAPGMRAAPAAVAGITAAAAANGPTLAESIAARQQQRRHPVPAAAAGAGAGGGGPPSAVMELRGLLGDEAFAEVKHISGEYRSGWMMPGEYFKAMEERLPADRFGWVFRVLLCRASAEYVCRSLILSLLISGCEKIHLVFQVAFGLTGVRFLFLGYGNLRDASLDFYSSGL